MATCPIRRLVVALVATLVASSSLAAEGDAPVLVHPGARAPGTVRTIQEGIDLAKPGGRVLVMAGTYEEKLEIRKALTLEGVGGGHGLVVVSPPGQPDAAILVQTTEPVVIRRLTVSHAGVNGIRGLGSVDLTVEDVALTAYDTPLPPAVPRLVSVNNPVPAPAGSRARFAVRDSFLDGGITHERSLSPPFGQVFGISVSGDVDAVLERNVIRRTGGACVAVFLTTTFGGNANVDVVGNDLDECYPLGRVAAVVIGPQAAGAPSAPGQVTATGTVNVIGNRIANSAGSCLPGSAISWEAYGGRIEHNTISGFVQACATPSLRGPPVAIAVGAFRPHFPQVNPTVRFNDLEGNAHGAVRIGRGEASPVDLRCNWWGSEDGPSGAGPGTGDALVVQDGAAAPVVAPWATRPIAGTAGAPCTGGAD